MFRAGHVLVVAVFALLAFGVVMVNSAGMSVGRESGVTFGSVLLGRTTWLAVAAMIALGLGTMVQVERTPKLRGLASPALWLVVGSIALLLLVHVPFIGHEVNGAVRWINVGPIGFQPSEIAKWAVPIVLAWWAARRMGAMRRFVSGFLPPMVFIGVTCLLIATEDLGTAVLIGAAGVFVLVAAGARPIHVAALVPPAAIGVVGLMIQSPYRIDRVRAFMDPYADPQGVGYHMLQSMTSVASGGLAGRGLGNSVQKFGYLPEDTTDFIYAIVCEELGIAGAVVIAALYAAILLGGLAIIRRLADPFSRLVALGVVVTIGLQALINMAVVTGSAPTKGIALPLISSGGTGWILTAFSIGLLVGLDRRRADAEEDELQTSLTPAAR